MVMTKLEAQALAGLIWAGKRIDFVMLMPDGHVRVCIEETPNVHYSFHELDEVGRPVCHTTCRGEDE